MSDRFHVVRHPLVRHKLSWLRQGSLSSRDYADLLRELGLLLGVEATRSLGFLPEDLGPADAPTKPRWPIIVAIVRSGLIMAEGVRHIMPSRHMGHIGVFFDDRDNRIIEFMVTMPLDLEDRDCLIVDAFSNSGRSAAHAIRVVMEYGVPSERILFLCCCISKQAYRALSTDADLEGVRFVCARNDGVEPGLPWAEHFDKMNYRLYGTRDRRLIMPEPPNGDGQ